MIAILSLLSAAAWQEAEHRFFESEVRPLFVRRCFKCHGPDSKPEAGLRVDSLAALLRGGETGPAIVPGKPEASLLIDAVRYGEIYQMPPKGKLPDSEIEILVRWVRLGAPWPDAAPHDRPATKREYEYTEADRSFWAFRPPVEPAPPPVKDRDWPVTPVDRFVLARLETRGLRPAPPADRRTLIRRATFDLHGLPPTPDEIDAFLSDASPGAFERVLERLLASPRYGERWGRRWLDVARYADSNGGDVNLLQAHAYRYRDYVIQSFNDDTPFDRFILEQLAGDLLPAADRRTRNRQWIATGFLALGPKPLLKNDNALAEMDVVDEQIRTFGRAFLALTLECSRCHDHKFDPLPMRDYYALAGIFKSTRTVDRYPLRVNRSWTERALGSDAEEETHRRLKKEVTDADDRRRLSNRKEDITRYSRMRDRIRSQLARIPVAVAVREGEAADCALHLRGNPQTLGPPVKRGVPEILAGGRPLSIPDGRSGRLELARWLAAPENPLTSRVIVNRIWRGHFGEGIVRSTDNFGRLGERPDNVPLLDWLAVRFVRGGGSIKSLHRLLMGSSAYRMSSRYDERAASVDPENRLLWRFRPRRLDAEEIRDAMLAVSGRLDSTEGGPALPPALNFKGFGQNRRITETVRKAYERPRRSVYLPIIRSGLWDYFKIFDFADPGVPTGGRRNTTVAPQALFMMNSAFSRRAGGDFSRRLLSDAKPSNVEIIRRAWERAFGRPPSDADRSAALDFLKRYSRAMGPSADARDRALEALCRSLLSSNEFVYVD